MNVRWKKLLVKTSLWLVAEIWLNFLGIDNLADYSEFIFERHEMVQPLISWSTSNLTIETDGEIGR